MADAISLNNINSIQDKWQPSGSAGVHQPGQEPLSSVMPVDRVSLSPQALKEQAGQRDKKNLNEEQKQQVEELKKRDTEVKSHEQAHMASGGGLVQGGASFEYQSGPDGKMYAVGGEVKIDVSPERTPEATIRKMQQVRRAALAPAEPSGADRSVAAQATQIEARARMERTQNAQAGTLPGNDMTGAPSEAAPPANASAANGTVSIRQATGRHIDLVI
jgi:SprA-related family